MVAYLKKPEGSEEFHQIVDFLNASHIRYALTGNSTIYVSLIKQFWETATARTLDTGEVELTATVDGKVKIITEASVRRHLQLADSDGISSLPNTEIFEQLSLMGYMSTSDKLTFQKGYFSPQWIFLIHTILHCLSPKKTSWEQFSSNIATAIICLATNRKFNFSKLIFSKHKFLMYPRFIQGPVVQGEGSTYPVESHHTPTNAPSTSQPLISPTSRRTIRQESVVPQPRSPTQTYVADEAASTCMDVRYGGDVTTITGLEARHGSGNIDKTPTMPQDLPLLRVNTLGSDEGSLTLQELTVLCTTLSKKVESLETNLKQTKLTYGASYTKLIKNVKKLENKVKSNQARRRARIHDIEFEFDLDAAKDVSTAEEDISTAKPVSTAAATVTTASVDVSTATVSTAKDKGKGIMEEFKHVQTKTKLGQEQERLGYEAALRLQAELKEEERQRIATRVEADEELAQRLQAEEREKYSEVEKARLLAELVNQRKSEIERAIPELTTGSSKRDAEEELSQESSKRQKTRESLEIYTKGARKYWKIIRVGNHTEVYQFFDDMLKAFDKEDLVKLWSLVELKILFEPDIDDELWKLQKHIHDLTWRLYDSCGVHHVSTDKGIDIYMLIEKEYPLSRGTLTQMLVAKLLVEQDNEMSRELLRKIFMQVERPRR
ncbi:hypothetical protein Tco_0143484 [Tanacetum coccineum]